jgi:hypothetical protein
MLCSALALHCAGSILSNQIFMAFPRAETKQRDGVYKEPSLENLNMNTMKLLEVGSISLWFNFTWDASPSI